MCKQFKSTFESHPEFVQRLYLDDGFSFPLVPSLVAWLQHNKSSVRMLQSKCKSPMLDIVMRGLLLAPNISMVDVHNVSACTMMLAGTFKRLEKCTLSHEAGYLDLAPLGGLPRLNHLRLEGGFGGLHHLTGLTQLECDCSHVLDVQEFAPALQYLEVVHGNLEGIHARHLVSLHSTNTPSAA